MVGAYVLASELAAHRAALVAGITAYEEGLRAYVIRNQDIALEQHTKPDEPSSEPAGAMPDFGALTLPFTFKSYEKLVERP